MTYLGISIHRSHFSPILPFQNLCDCLIKNSRTYREVDCGRVNLLQGQIANDVGGIVKHRRRVNGETVTPHCCVPTGRCIANSCGTGQERHVVRRVEIRVLAHDAVAEGLPRGCAVAVVLVSLGSDIDVEILGDIVHDSARSSGIYRSYV